MKYPVIPTPYTVEIEVTNYCNAKCRFCNNENSTRKKGYIDVEHFTSFIRRNAKLQRTFSGRVSPLKIPRVVLSGLGEPTLHPDIVKLVSICKENSFRVQLVTNGSTLTKRLVKELIGVGLDEIAISLHSINPSIYEEITSLDFRSAFMTIKRALVEFCTSNTAIEIWRILPTINNKRETIEDEITFRDFIRNYPGIKVMGPSEPWSRDGKVIDSICDLVNDDPSGKVWCHKIFFTYNIAYDGSIVICCNDYNRMSIEMGNGFDLDYEDTIAQRLSILRSEARPEICKACRRWPDTEYHKYLHMGWKVT